MNLFVGAFVSVWAAIFIYGLGNAHFKQDKDDRRASTFINMIIMIIAIGVFFIGVDIAFHTKILLP